MHLDKPIYSWLTSSLASRITSVICYWIHCVSCEPALSPDCKYLFHGEQERASSSLKGTLGSFKYVPSLPSWGDFLNFWFYFWYIMVSTHLVYINQARAPFSISLSNSFFDLYLEPGYKPLFPTSYNLKPGHNLQQNGNNCPPVLGCFLVSILLSTF